MTAGGRERDPYFFNTAEAAGGTLLFRPRRRDDITNVTCGIPIASGRAIAASSNVAPGGLRNVRRADDRVYGASRGESVWSHKPATSIVDLWG